MNEQPNQPTETRRWMMFDVTPQEMLGLFRMLAIDGVDAVAPQMPPDLEIVDGFYDDERGVFTSVLQSDFFDPVPIEFGPDNSISGAWPRLLFKLDETESADLNPDTNWTPVASDDLPLHAIVPATPPVDDLEAVRQARWQMLWVAPDEFLRALQRIATKQNVRFAQLPDDVQIVSATHEPERGFGLLLQSDEFSHPRVELFTDDDGESAARLEIEEAYLGRSEG